MGWASGSEVMCGVIRAVKAEVTDKEARKRIYAPIIETLRDADWDTEDECLDRDEAYDELYDAEYPPDAIDEEIK